MILKHLLILAIANYCLDTVENGVASYTADSSTNIFENSEDYDVSSNYIQSYTTIYSTQSKTTHLNTTYSKLSGKQVPVFGNFLFAVNKKMSKGEYVQHVLRDEDGSKLCRIQRKELIQYASHAWVYTCL